MYLYLPVALTSINILFPIGLGLAVGLLSGLFGVGGGFLMTPLLLMLGIRPTVAAATDSNQIVAASVSGTYAHWKVGNVDFKMGFYLLIGGFLGGLVGVEFIKILRTMGDAGFMIKVTYVLMLGIVGAYMFIESLSSMKKKAEEVKTQKGSRMRKFLESLPLQTHFEKSGVTHSALVPIFFWRFCRNPRSNNGCRRRIFDGAGNGLYVKDADACRSGDKPVSDFFHLHGGHISSGKYQPHR